jgi:hypothetical protein
LDVSVCIFGIIGLSRVSLSNSNRSLVLDNECLLWSDRKAVIRYFGKEKEFRIPAAVELISNGCFRNCTSLCNVRFEEHSKLRRIGTEAFLGSGITSITIPPYVDIIEERSFTHCQALREVTFEGTPTIRKKAFDECPLEVITLPVRATLNYSFGAVKIQRSQHTIAQHVLKRAHSCSQSGLPKELIDKALLSDDGVESASSFPLNLHSSTVSVFRRMSLSDEPEDITYLT